MSDHGMTEVTAVGEGFCQPVSYLDSTNPLLDHDHHTFTGRQRTDPIIFPNLVLAAHFWTALTEPSS